MKILQFHTSEKQFKMKVLIVAVGFAILAQFACSLVIPSTPEPALQVTEVAPTRTPTQPQAPSSIATQENPPQPSSAEEFFVWDGIALYFDPTLTLGAEATTISAANGENPYEPDHPEYIQFDLLGRGTVSVVSIPDYIAAADFSTDLFNDLETLIAQQPIDVEECIPELPLGDSFMACDHQQFNANVAQLDFQNGSGVRYVTVYAQQDAVPVSNENLAYIFQGITDDGKYYIKAGFRITHTQVEEFVMDFPPGVYEDANGAALQDYFSRYEQMFDNQPENFEPLLDIFDALIQSLRVEKAP